MSEFLIELRFAESDLAASLLGMQKFGHRIFEELMSRGLPIRQIVSAIGRDRAALVALGLPSHEPDNERQVLGPLLTADLALLDHFASTVGRSRDELVRIPTTGGWRFAAVETLPGRPTSLVMAGLIRTLLAENRSSFSPMAGLWAIFDGEPLDVALDALRSSPHTVGPRGEELQIRSYAEYRQVLTAAGSPLWSLMTARKTLKDPMVLQVPDRQASR